MIPLKALNKILVLEDDDLDFDLLQRHLRPFQSPKYELVRAVNADAAQILTQKQPFDAALIDYKLSGGADGLKFVRELGGRQAPFPIVLLTGMDDANLDKEAILSGAYDYIDKFAQTGEIVDRAIRFSISTYQYERQLRKLLEESTEQANINRRLLSIVSHEMKSPLSSIIGYSDYIIESCTNEQSRKAASKMKAASLHLEDFLLNLSEFVKLDSGAARISQAQFALKPMLCETIDFFRPYAAHKEISISERIDQTTDNEFIGDRLRIRQILINLVRNAINYSNDGKITISASINQDILHVTVQDEGIGIAEEKLDALLAKDIKRHEPGHNLEGGLGIGISICRRLLRLMGGTFDIKSKPGVGTIASFEIPLQRPAE